jgi:hypothetical protein
VAINSHFFLPFPSSNPNAMPAHNCTLWPPDGELRQVASVSAVDGVSGLGADAVQVTASGNEPLDVSDVVVTPDGSGAFNVQSRAERLGAGAGKTYTLSATAADLAGNVTVETATCTVPHDLRRR